MSSPAQDASPEAARAAREEAEERAKRLSGDVEALSAAVAEMQKKISALSGELSKIREEQTRLANSSSSHDAIKTLSEKIQEVDKKRESDKKDIAEEIKQLGKILASSSKGNGGGESVSPRKEKSPKTTPKVETTDSEPSGSPEKGYEYKVQPNDSVSKIIAAYNAEFKSKGMKPVTLAQVLKANEGLKPEKLKVGQKIFIPMPAQ